MLCPCPCTQEGSSALGVVCSSWGGGGSSVHPGIFCMWTELAKQPGGNEQQPCHMQPLPPSSPEHRGLPPHSRWTQATPPSCVNGMLIRAAYPCIRCLPCTRADLLLPGSLWQPCCTLDRSGHGMTWHHLALFRGRKCSAACTRSVVVWLEGACGDHGQDLVLGTATPQVSGGGGGEVAWKLWQRDCLW